MFNFYKQYLVNLQNKHQYRKLSNRGQGKLGEALLDFSTNDYLNLSRSKILLEAALEKARIYGVGATGSRLLSGNNDLFENFEKQIAYDKKTEASLIFSSGFQANISVLTCLLDAQVIGHSPLVFFDKLNHASLYNAVFLSKANLLRYKHNDMLHLAQLLEKYKNPEQTKFIVSETLFGMDGDIAQLQDLVALAKEYKAFLYLDEAHAAGLFGAEGYGLSTSLDLTSLDYLLMGTFSKAIGASGGYVASSKLICEYILNKAAGFIYSTAPSPMAVGGAFKAWQLIGSLSKEREYLFQLSLDLREKLLASGFDIGTSTTHIIPVLIGKEDKCLALQQKLLEENILVSCIRPPTVPPNSSRLRIALNVGHSREDIEYLVNILRKLI